MAGLQLAPELVSMLCLDKQTSRKQFAAESAAAGGFVKAQRMTMVTIKEEAPRKAKASSPDWPPADLGMVIPLDSALLATLSSRLHCRTPMTRVDRAESAMRGSVRFDARRSTSAAETNPAPDRVATYRCMCGFTMDVPAISVDYAAAC